MGVGTGRRRRCCSRECGAAALRLQVDAIGGTPERTTLHAALRAGHTKVVRVLIKEFGAILDPADRCGPSGEWSSGSLRQLGVAWRSVH